MSLFFNGHQYTLQSNFDKACQIQILYVTERNTESILDVYEHRKGSLGNEKMISVEKDSKEVLEGIRPTRKFSREKALTECKVTFYSLIDLLFYFENTLRYLFLKHF